MAGCLKSKMCMLFEVTLMQISELAEEVKAVMVDPGCESKQLMLLLFFYSNLPILILAKLSFDKMLRVTECCYVTMAAVFAVLAAPPLSLPRDAF